MATATTEARTFTRQQFYEYVWSKPATKLADELGCSNVMIGKICRKYDIPKPYVGYWAQLAHNKNPKQTPLPKSRDPLKQSLTFHRHENLETTVDEPPRELQYDADVRQMLDLMRQLGPIKVSKQLRNPHALVATTQKKINARIADEKKHWQRKDYAWRKIRALTVNVSPALTKRAMRIMDAIVKRIESIGGAIEIRDHQYFEHRDSRTMISLGGEDVIEIRLREKHNQVRHINKDAKYSWERNRTELVPSGRLLFDDGPSTYRSPLAIDGKKKQVEDQLTDMVTDFVIQLGERRIKQRERAEEEHRKAEEVRREQERQERMRVEQEKLEQQRAEEQARLDELIFHAESWQKSQLIREYLDALCERCLTNNEVTSVPLSSRTADYLRWGFDRRIGSIPCPIPANSEPTNLLN